MDAEVIEGTWEYVRSHDAGFRGRHVRLTVLPPQPEPETPARTPPDLAALLGDVVGVVDGTGEDVAAKAGALFADIVAQRHTGAAC